MKILVKPMTKYRKRTISNLRKQKFKVGMSIKIRRSTIKGKRDILMEEARASVPEPGSGRVLHLIRAFEKLLTIPKESQNDKEEVTKEGIKWAFPGLVEEHGVLSYFNGGGRGGGGVRE